MAWIRENYVFDLDRHELDAECEQCGFWNEFTIKEARLDQVIICRGCKANIQLRDYMGTVKRSERNVRRAMREFEDTLKSLNTTITLRL